MSPLERSSKLVAIKLFFRTGFLRDHFSLSSQLFSILPIYFYFILFFVKSIVKELNIKFRQTATAVSVTPASC